ncbi:methyltransferase domain-containing protein [Candidatus Uhrbacteria bacterium]|nr:methyltransferase domain-containing protein [Candidatus Uhrbacteria bacterium]
MKNETMKKIKNEVAGFYELEGDAFGHTRHHVWELMLDFMSRLKNGDTLVDVGAGNARLLDVVPEGVNYVGIEPSSSLREFAASRLVSHEQSKMMAGGFPKLELEDGIADAVTCIAVLHHVPGEADRKASVKELHRILKPGGSAIVSVWNLRAKRFLSWKMFKNAWLRIPGFLGGDKGDLYYIWKAGKTPRQRYVHAFTLREFRSFFDEKDWDIEKIDGYDSKGWTNWFAGRNLVAVATKKIINNKL